MLKNIGAKGGYPACGATGDTLIGKPINSSIWGARPEWCPFDSGDKIEFVFVPSNTRKDEEDTLA